jgi:pimeloyl-ACP methyl ester carboxylesterase
MAELDLSAGTLEYQDTGGSGPVLVLLHGLLMDGSLWDGVVAELAADFRCVVPTLPFGAHRRPVSDDADLSLPGLARLVAEFLDRLDVRDVTLVGNDTGGAVTQVLIADEEAARRVGRAVLVSCEAFDNLPPGLTGRTIALLGKLSPGAFGLFMQQMRLKPVRRMPFAFGRLTKRGDAATKRWARPVLTDAAIRRDAVRMLRAVFQDRDLLVRTAEILPKFQKPVLVVWAAGDRVMPPDHGRRLAGTFADARHVEIEDSYTLIPLDQPVGLAQALRGFAAP